MAPAVVAYNAGTEATTVTGRLRITVPEGAPMAFEVASVQLAAGATRLLDLYDLWVNARVFSVATAGRVDDDAGAWGLCARRVVQAGRVDTRSIQSVWRACPHGPRAPGVGPADGGRPCVAGGGVVFCAPATARLEARPARAGRPSSQPRHSRAYHAL